MWILKTFISPYNVYLECEYKNKYPTYWFATKKMDMDMDIWDSGMREEIRTYIPIGYMYENT